MLNWYVVRAANNKRQAACKNSRLQATYKKRKQTANNKRHTSNKQKQIGR